jgi:SAM-dependent methyltransferase
MSSCGVFEEEEVSKLKVFFGEEIYKEFEGKTVLDYGCGTGWACVDLALHGAAQVIGLDIIDENLEAACKLAAKHGVSDKCTFTKSVSAKADVILSMDAFEHFMDPASILVNMSGLMKDDGCAIVTFGYTWYHPLGGHLFSVFPWAHLIFPEKALIRWRSDFKTDGATRFGEVSGGLNQMTIRRWEKLVSESPFKIVWQRIRPIRAFRWFYCRLTRELFTSTLQMKLVQRRGEENDCFACSRGRKSSAP